jgi:hypothetical protein
MAGVAVAAEHLDVIFMWGRTPLRLATRPPVARTV